MSETPEQHARRTARERAASLILPAPSVAQIEALRKYLGHDAPATRVERNAA